MNALERASNERNIFEDKSSQIEILQLGFANLAGKAQLGGAANDQQPFILHATCYEGSQAQV
jgi:hypothetical protein